MGCGVEPPAEGVLACRQLSDEEVFVASSSWP
jgi:hypothetical protein